MISLTVLLIFTLIGAVSAANTNTALTFSQNPTTVGTPVTVTATVTSGGNPIPDMGHTVTFSVDGSTQAVVPVINGQASFTYTPSTSGSKSVTARYNGGNGYGTSQDTKTLTVNPAPKSSTTLTVDPASGTKGGTTTLRARLTSGGTVLPGKNVIFKVGGSTTGVGPVSFDGTYYTCSYTISQSRGTYTNSITAEFAEDSNYYGSNGANTLNVLNSNPIANNDYAKVTQNSYVDIDVSSLLTNDTDVDGDMLHFIGITQMPTYGPLVQVGPTTYRYTNVGYMGTDSFKYQITDGFGGTAIGTVFINVNHIPIAVNDAFSVNEDGTLTGVSAAGNDTTGDGANTWHLVSGPSHGTLTFNPDGSFTYTPTSNYNGQDSFTYYISDADENSNTATVSLTVNPVNDAPVAVNDFATTDEDTPTAVTVLPNDSDVDGDTLTVTSVTQPANGSVTLVGGVITYTPASNWFGSETFTYTISDGNGETATATVTMNVNSVNDAPVATGDSQTTAEDTPVNGAVTATDVDGDSLTFTEGTGPTNGTVVVNTDGTYTYTPDANFNGDDSFTLIVSDGQGGTDEVTVYITVTPVNDAPIAVDNTVTTPEDTASGYGVLGNDYDVDGDSLTITGVTQPTNGVVVNYGTYVEYTPNSNYNGPDQFTYTISDGNGGTATATVTVNVISVNDAPVTSDDTKTTKQDTPVTIDVLANDTDVDNDTLTITGVSDPAHGTTVIIGGKIVYAPDAGYYGTDSFTYTISDGNQGTATGTVNITVERAVASVYVLTTVSKNNPTVGETITVTFKLGNNGPDAADDVVFTYVIPEGMEFVSLETEPGYPIAVYDPATRTITWTLGTVPKIDPWLNVNVKVLKAGNFNINPAVTTSTYDPTIGSSVQSATVNAVNVANAASNTSSTVGMQETGVPFAGLILAILALFAGLVAPKRK